MSENIKHDKFSKKINYVNNTKKSIEQLTNEIKELSVRKEYYNFHDLKEDNKKVTQSNWWENMF
tara:strand:+ start:712 stop:903 length:192 start_codon:yes stop_codon:yes gene_type:complete